MLDSSAPLIAHNHFLANFAIAGAYAVIPAMVFRQYHRFPKEARGLVALSAAFVLTCGVGHALEALGAWSIMAVWHWITAAVSWMAAIAFVRVLPKAISRMELLAAMLRNVPAGMAVFATQDDDLLALEVSDFAQEHSQYRLTPGASLCEVSDARQSGLFQDYVLTLTTGQPMASRRVESFLLETGKRQVCSYSAVRLSGGELLAVWLDVSELIEAQGALQEARSRLEWLANHDELTNALSLRHFRQLEECGPTPAGVIYIDLDRFKAVNDTLGHRVGDALLRQVVRRLTVELDDEGALIRVGGDEFLVALDHASSLDAIATRAWTLLALIQQPFIVDDREIRIDASIGVADCSAGSLEDMRTAADLAMYAAKEDCNAARVRVWSQEILLAARHRERIQLALRSDISNDFVGFELHYQPIVMLTDLNRCTLVEALLRWDSPTLGEPVSPADFVPIAETSGSIYQLSDWAIETAIAQAAAWQGKMSISVNVSPWDLERQGFVERLLEWCDRYGTSPQCLAIEITERTVTHNWRHLLAVLEKLSMAQFAIKIDDFGMGYSGLESLLKVHRSVRSLKIDREFVPMSIHQRDRVALCRSMASLCKDLGLQCIAEGIETQQQVDIVRSLGIDYGQGWLFSKAVSAVEIADSWFPPNDLDFFDSSA